MDISVPFSAAALKEELGGMTVSLPQGLGIGTILPESIQSMINTEDIKINLETPELPQAVGVSQVQQQQEQIIQYINTGEQNLNTERGTEQNINTERGEAPPVTTKKEKEGAK